MNRWVFFGLFLIVSAPLFPAGQDESRDSSPPVAFILAHNASDELLDPHFFSSPATLRLWNCLYDGLIVSDPVTGQGVPGLAESWDVSPDGLTYTFHLRLSYWGDGTQVRADQAAASWMRILNPLSGSPHAWYPALFIRGAREFREGTGTPDKVGVTAADPRTLIVKLASPCPFFIEALIHQSFAVLPMHLVQDGGSGWDTLSGAAGNGAYRVEKPLQEGAIRLVRKESSGESGRPGSLVFLRVESPAAALKEYRKGLLDWIPADLMDPLSLPGLRDDPDYLVSGSPSSYFYIFNTERPALKDPGIRRALSLAVDREKLIGDLLRGNQIPSWSLIPALTGYSALPPEHSDFTAGLEEGRDLFIRAGYRERQSFPVLDLIFLEGEGHRAVAEFLREQWREHLDIEIRLKGLSAQTYYSEREKGNFDLSLGGWLAAYQDPSAFLNLFLSGESLFGGSYSSRDFDALMIESTALQDREERCRTLRKAEELLCRQDTALLPLFSYSASQLINREVWSGFYPNPRDLHPLEPLRLR